MTKVPTFTARNRWTDRDWLTQRAELYDICQNTAGLIVVDVSNLAWLDLQPLTDLFLHLATRRMKGLDTRLCLPPVGAHHGSPALPFLRSTGFLDALLEPAWDGALTLVHEGSEISLKDLENLRLRRGMARLVLRSSTVVPLNLLDMAQLPNRTAIVRSCYNLWRHYLMGGQASSKLGLSVPLVYELKVFFNAVLPELIDNTKIHKGSREPNLAALFVRLRKRESGLRSRAERIAEPSTQELTRLKKRSRHFWQGDFIEATYCDHGPAIHTTWREGWFEQHGRSSSPRLPDGQSLRNPFSPHADLQILKAIFEQGASSVPPDRRKELGLPNLHGLQAVGHAVSESDCLFSVSSGQNTVLVGRSHLVGRQDDAHSTADEQMRVVPVSRAPDTDGVHYFFRAAATTDPPISNKDWIDALPPEGIVNDPSWWASHSSADSSASLHFIDTFEVPNQCRPGDVLVCRANHPKAKNEMGLFIADVNKNYLNLVFAEVSPRIGLYIKGILDLLRKSDDLDIVAPIVTSAMRATVTTQDARALARNFAEFAPAPSLPSGPWWNEPGCPIRCVRDLFVACRAEDSRRFWDIVDEDRQPSQGDSSAAPVSFLSEPVEWSDGWLLNGGYLHLPLAWRRQDLWKLVRKRLVLAAQALRATSVVPGVETMRWMTTEVERNVVPVRCRQENSVAITNVIVTGRTHAPAQSDIPLPVFVYPSLSIQRPDGTTIDQEATGHSARPWQRALNWLQRSGVEPERNEEGICTGSA